MIICSIKSQTLFSFSVCVSLLLCYFTMLFITLNIRLLLSEVVDVCITATI